jgi:Uma2 family endonuclease
MTAMVARYTDAPVPLGEYVPTADRRMVMHGMTWASFKTMLAARGERRWPRMAYLDGAVELMGASRHHEDIKSGIHDLVSAYCLDNGIRFRCYGSYLIDDESLEAGAEPDDCYVFGAQLKERERPDLVVEVIWTSGGIDKLNLYRRLGVREVWFWKANAIAVHVLGDAGYEVHEQSAFLPDLDLGLVCELLGLESVNEMVEQLRSRLPTPVREPPE